jgi:hypothetical protein
MSTVETPVLFHQRTLVCADVDHKQQLMHLPMDFVRRYPPSYEAEFKPIPNGLLSLRIVDPRSTAMVKRYRVIRHHGGAWVSVPRPWLRDRSARDGDEIELLAVADEAEIFYIRFNRKPKVA